MRTLFSRYQIAGASLVECVAATSIISIFFAGAFSLNSEVLAVLHQSKDSSTAEQCLRDTLDRLRNTSWEQLSNSQALSDNVLGAPVNSAATCLPGFSTSLSVAPFRVDGSASAEEPISLTRTGGSTSVNTAGGPNLSQEEALLAKCKVSWQSGQRTRAKEAYAVISRQGINGRNQ